MAAQAMRGWWTDSDADWLLGQLRSGPGQDAEIVRLARKGLDHEAICGEDGSRVGWGANTEQVEELADQAEAK